MNKEGRVEAQVCDSKLAKQSYFRKRESYSTTMWEVDRGEKLLKKVLECLDAIVTCGGWKTVQSNSNRLIFVASLKDGRGRKKT